MSDAGKLDSTLSELGEWLTQDITSEHQYAIAYWAISVNCLWFLNSFCITALLREPHVAFIYVVFDSEIGVCISIFTLNV